MLELDPIGVIELSYQPHASETVWLAEVAERLRPGLDVDNFGLVAYFMTPEGPRDTMVLEAPGSPFRRDELAGSLAQGLATAPPETLERLAVALQIPGFSTLVEATGWIVDTEPRFTDSPAVVIRSGEGPPAVIGSFQTSPVKVSDADRQIWRRLALHLGAGLRLVGRSRELDADDVEAIVDHRGAVVHAAGEGAKTDSLEAIRQAVKHVDRARSRTGRSDPVAALELWQALLEGRWSLVEQFDTDGRRFLTARRNDPAIAEPRGLTPRERQVVFYAGLGWSLKEIGYALGLATSTINSHLGKALAQLGLGSRAELVRVHSALASTPTDPDP